MVLSVPGLCPFCGRAMPNFRFIVAVFCSLLWLLFVDMRQVDPTNLPRIFDTPRPIARLFLAAPHPIEFGARGHNGAVATVPPSPEREDVSKWQAMTSRAAARDRSPGGRHAQGAPGCGDAWDQPVRRKFGSMLPKNI